ncbi:DNA polymerase III subunit alpha, partial [Gammaproteobacteria bacterium]|nr:DNA polymerase III subunit alpha [Gammaproteobacteria bacterium]
QRDRVIDYVSRRYGADNVSQIITFGTLAAKAVVRDVGRALNHPFGLVDSIAKMIPFEVGITLDKAVEQEPDLKNRLETDEEAAEIFTEARKLEGLIRNYGRHAGGVVIAPRPLYEFTALYSEEGGSPVAQFDKDDLEAIGLVKFDFLGLKTLTVIDRALKFINKNRELDGDPPINIKNLPLDDKPTYQLVQAAKTTAVFQLESRGMKELISRLVPDTFEDLIALVALYRPGPLDSGMVDDYVNRKHGRAETRYPHPDLEPVLDTTYGVILYQEQVMEISRVLAGYSLGGADILRRAMGKKKPEEMEKQREFFVTGATDRAIEPSVSGHVFDLMEKFAGYGFNKSHSAAYALVSYQTAWLKTHYTAAFLAATMNAELNNTEKVVGLIRECRSFGIAVDSPDINAGDFDFVATAPDRVSYGLGAIKGVGRGVVEAIVEARNTVGGQFRSLDHLCQAVPAGTLQKRLLETLVRSGAIDALGPNRASLLAAIPNIAVRADQYHRNRSSGQTDLFGLVSGGGEDYQEAPIDTIEPWPIEKTLIAERDLLGHFVSGHLVEPWRERFGDLLSSNLAVMEAHEDGSFMLVVALAGVRTLYNKRGEKMAILMIEDESAQAEVMLPPEHLGRLQDELQRDAVLMIRVTRRRDRFSGRLQTRIEKIDTANAFRDRYLSRLTITVDLGATEKVESLIEMLDALSGKPLGNGAVVTINFVFVDERGQRIDARGRQRVAIDAVTIEQLLRQLGIGTIQFSFNPPWPENETVESEPQARPEPEPSTLAYG